MKRTIFLIVAGMLLCACSSDEPAEVTAPRYVQEQPDGLQAVDLGLSALWATCNLGANTPEEYGGYYAWGDPTGMLWSGEGIYKVNDEYVWETDNYGGKEPKYTNKNGNSGTELDVVTQNWGDGWRTPTLKEATELCTKCQWKLMNENGRKFYRVIGPNGNYIDMPLGGAYLDGGATEELRFMGTLLEEGKMGVYWTSTASFPGVNFDGGRGYNVNKYVYQAYAFCCNSVFGDITNKGKFMTHLRSMHFSIRPVRDK